MKSDITPYEKIREYLLGKSTSEDSVLVEERYLADDEFYQQLLVVEDELVDQYLAGSLPEAEREPFENYFLASPERREKLRFTRNLKKYVTRAGADQAPVADLANVVPARNVFRPPQRQQKKFSFWSQPIASYSLAAAAVIVVALVGVNIYWNTLPESGKVLAVELLPGVTRGEETIKEIKVPADTGTVELELRGSNFSANQTFRAIIQAADGNEISRQDNLRPDPASSDRIICPVSAALLKPGNYNLKLSGLNQGNYQDIARYYFRITQ